MCPFHKFSFYRRSCYCAAMKQSLLKKTYLTNLLNSFLFHLIFFLFVFLASCLVSLIYNSSLFLQLRSLYYPFPSDQSPSAVHLKSRCSSRQNKIRSRIPWSEYCPDSQKSRQIDRTAKGCSSRIPPGIREEVGPAVLLRLKPVFSIIFDPYQLELGLILGGLALLAHKVHELHEVPRSPTNSHELPKKGRKTDHRRARPT